MYWQFGSHVLKPAYNTDMKIYAVRNATDDVLRETIWDSRVISRDTSVAAYA